MFKYKEGNMENVSALYFGFSLSIAHSFSYSLSLKWLILLRVYRILNLLYDPFAHKYAKEKYRSQNNKKDYYRNP